MDRWPLAGVYRGPKSILGVYNLAMLEDRRKMRLHNYLTIRNREPEKCAEVGEKIWNEFGTECTVLVSDMSGYTKTTRDLGIVHFLALHRKSLELSYPIVEGAEGI